MTYDLPIYVRLHHDGRVTAVLLDRDLDLTAHAGTREEALSQIGAAVERRIEDPDDPLGDRLVEATRPELRRVKVGVRVRRRSGRRAEVQLAVTCAVTRRKEGGVEAIIPRLRTAFDLTSAEDIDGALEDEVRGGLAGASDLEALALAPDRDESFETLSIDAPPRARILARRKPPKPAERDGVLEEIGQDLGALFRRGQAAGAYNRDGEVGQVLAALSADPPVSVLLVGPSGVGKSAIASESARRLALGEADPALLRAGVRIIHVSGSRILSGMGYFGDWQQRAKLLVEEARERRAALFVDDLAELCESDSGEGGGGVARFLAPHVARGEVALIAEATPERLRRVERIDASLVTLFRRIDVHEMQRDAAIAVLARLSGPLCRPHGISLAGDALEAAVDATTRFQAGRRLPGKAVDLLRRLVERESARRKDEVRRAGKDAPPPPPLRLGKREALAAFARESGLPEVVLRDDLPLERDELLRGFEGRVVEQPAAARALADAVLLAKAGLANPGKPIAVYLFAGPTGVGKTESAKALAERLFGDPARLMRFDMSEYQDGAGALRLAGGEGVCEGELPRRVREQPFSVILLDEIEKAHEAVFDMLLSVLGEGRLVDHGGRVADFRSAIVIMTSNLGAEEKDGIGFASAGAQGEEARRDAVAERYRAAAAAFFRPELLNRIDRVVPFRPLSLGAIEKIARRELDAIVAREGLERRRIAIRFAEGLVPALARAGFHPRHGARPLKREIERRVLAPLARYLVRRAGRSDVAIELSLDAEGGDEVRIAATDRAPRTLLARELFDAPAEGETPPSPARLREAIGLVRVRLLDTADLAAARLVPGLLGTRAGREAESVASALHSLATLEAEVERVADLDPGHAKERAARVAALDEEATRLELAALCAQAALPPLAALRVLEEAPAATPGAAAEAVAASIAAWAGWRGARPERSASGDGALLVRFGDPARAAPLEGEAGLHDFARDIPAASLRGARVRVERAEATPLDGAPVVRRHECRPAAGATDPRSGLFQRGAAPPAPPVLERFLLGARRSAPPSQKSA